MASSTPRWANDTQLPSTTVRWFDPSTQLHLSVDDEAACTARLCESMQATRTPRSHMSCDCWYAPSEQSTVVRRHDGLKRDRTGTGTDCGERVHPTHTPQAPPHTHTPRIRHAYPTPAHTPHIPSALFCRGGSSHHVAVVCCHSLSALPLSVHTTSMTDGHAIRVRR